MKKSLLLMVSWHVRPGITLKSIVDRVGEYSTFKVPERRSFAPQTSRNVALSHGLSHGLTQNESEARVSRACDWLNRKKDSKEIGQVRVFHYHRNQIRD